MNPDVPPAAGSTQAHMMYDVILKLRNAHYDKLIAAKVAEATQETDGEKQLVLLQQLEKLKAIRRGPLKPLNEYEH